MKLEKRLREATADFEEAAQYRSAEPDRADAQRLFRRAMRRYGRALIADAMNDYADSVSHDIVLDTFEDE